MAARNSLRLDALGPSLECTQAKVALFQEYETFKAFFRQKTIYVNLKLENKKTYYFSQTLKRYYIPLMLLIIHYVYILICNIQIHVIYLVQASGKIKLPNDCFYVLTNIIVTDHVIQFIQCSIYILLSTLQVPCLLKDNISVTKARAFS